MKYDIIVVGGGHACPQSRGHSPPALRRALSRRPCTPPRSWGS